MANAVIVQAVRTAVGRKNGKLASVRPDDLLADTLKVLVERAGIEATEIEDVIIGWGDPVGEQGMNIARNAAYLAAAQERPVGMQHLLEATRLEYTKLGQPLTTTEIRGWLT